MKKKIISCLTIMFALTLITGCNEKKTEEKNAPRTTQTPVKEEAKTKELTIYDEGAKYTTVFTYSKEKDYKIKKTDDSGKFIEVVFEIPEKNLSFDVYYFESTKTSYDTGKDNRKESENFKEYTWNKYEGYTYNGDKYSMDFNILLSELEDSNMIVGLFGTVEYINYEDANVVEDFNSKEVQDLLKTITFKIG